MTVTSRLADLAGADAVIEAVVEHIEVKRELFSRLDAALPDAQFLASNTSSIPIAELAAATGHPERVLGLHFLSPVPVMKLVEIVLALDTSDEVTAAAEELVHEIGKQPSRPRIVPAVGKSLCDLIGLDVLYAVCNSLYDEFKRDEYAPPPLITRIVASGRLGRKTGRGFYDYAG